ncbi:MAG: acyloxyacyl hydrolase [Crocinitomicaceae bacterium]|nr:acyloxyacyl hydrolase [Crocinitomicaceae bacterium]
MKLLHFLLFTLMVQGIFAQEKEPRSISVLTKTGFLIAHRSQMSHLVQGLNYGVELEFAKQRSNFNFYSEGLRWPVQGFSVSYQDFGFREVLGLGIGVMQFTKFNLIQREKIGFLDLKLASGFSIITKDYDAIENPKNNAIGSHLNHLISAQLTWEKHLGHVNFGLGLEINHYSNASMNAPNLGLNTPMLHVKLGYNDAPRQVYTPFEGPVIAVLPRFSNNFHVALMTTFKQNLPGLAPSKFLPIVGVQAAYRRYLNLKWDLEGTVDVIYNQANRVFYEDQSYSFMQTVQLGATVGVAYNFYKAQIYIGLGGYLYNQINPAGWIYNRIGYRRKFGDAERWLGFCGIKAHLGKADYMEAGVAYVF